MENTFVSLSVTSPQNPLRILNHLWRIRVWKYSCVDSLRSQIYSPVQSPSSWIYQWNYQDKLQPYYHCSSVCPQKVDLNLSFLQGVFSFRSLETTPGCWHLGHKGKLQPSVHLRKPFQPLKNLEISLFSPERTLSSTQLPTVTSTAGCF